MNPNQQIIHEKCNRNIELTFKITMHYRASQSQSSCSMFKKLVSMFAAVAVFRNYVLGNIARRTCRAGPGRTPGTPF